MQTNENDPAEKNFSSEWFEPLKWVIQQVGCNTIPVHQEACYYGTAEFL